MYGLATPIIIIVVGFFLSPAFGQRQITGKLIDGESKKPIKDAIVKIEGKEVQATSNFLGFFQLNVDNLDHLIIDSEGYELAMVQVPNVSNFQIALNKGQGEPLTFLVVEKSATFPGGLPAFYEYVGAKLRYPADAWKNGISGKVFVEFVIDTAGNIPPDEIRILKSLSKSCDDEVLRVMKESPRWLPGTQSGKPVRQRLVLPIAFAIGNMPHFQDFYSFMSRNIQYPLEARRSGLEGAIMVDFAVDDTGTVTSFIAPYDIGGGFVEEINRVLKIVPSTLMIPLIKESKSKIFTLPVLFGLQKPLDYVKPTIERRTFLLKAVNITAISTSIHLPSIRLASSPMSSDLNKAVEKPKTVKQLSLTNRGYTSLPLEILKLPKLEYLDLERNQLISLPDEIATLAELKELYLVENQIQTLPPTFSALKKIKVLGLASNKLNVFPEVVTSLENLEVLDLSGNGLSVIPPSIGRMQNLKFIVLQGNLIKTLPTEFYQLRKLEHIYLTGNPLEAKELALLKQQFKKAEIRFE